MMLNYELKPSHRLMLYAISHSPSVEIRQLGDSFRLLFPNEFDSYADVENVLKGLQFVGLVSIYESTSKRNPYAVSIQTDLVDLMQNVHLYNLQGSDSH